MSALAQVHVVIMYTHKTTVLLWFSGLCDIRVLFLYDVCQYAWRITSIRLNNVSRCPLILIPNMSGLLCPLLLNPGSRFASWMRANHYTTRASRNERSNIGACSLHATQVPNSCRKWHNIYILVLIHSPLYMSHTTLRWVVNVLSFPSMPLQIEVWAMQATQICIWSITCHSKLFMNTRSACTQRNETKAVVKSNACRRSVWGGVIQDVRSHKDLLCNAILFVGRSVCVAQYQSLYDATVAC